MKWDRGPGRQSCVTAIDEPPGDGIVIAHDLDGPDATRWPRFAPQAVEAGYRSLMSTSLTTEGGMRAALNLYAREPDAFDHEARQIAGLFATLLYGNQQANHLQHALDTRDVIGQAEGILMERFTVDDDDAFQMLVRSSQDTNMKLVDVARWLQHEATRRTTSSGRAPRTPAGGPHAHPGRADQDGPPSSKWTRRSSDVWLSPAPVKYLLDLPGTALSTSVLPGQGARSAFGYLDHRQMRLPTYARHSPAGLS